MYGGVSGCVCARARVTHLSDLGPLAAHSGLGRLAPRGPDGLAEEPWGQPGGARLLPAATAPRVLRQPLLVPADVPADLLGQLLQRLLGFAQRALVVLADLGQVGCRRRLAGPCPAAAAPGLRRGALLRAGRRRRLQGGGVEEDAAEQLGGVGQEEDGPEAEGDEGAEDQQQHELLRQAERAGARRLPAAAARAAAAAARAAAAAQGPAGARRATEQRQEAHGGHRACRAPLLPEQTFPGCGCSDGNFAPLRCRGGVSYCCCRRPLLLPLPSRLRARLLGERRARAG